jgi:hypothetical protein
MEMRKPVGRGLLGLPLLLLLLWPRGLGPLLLLLELLLLLWPRGLGPLLLLLELLLLLWLLLL